MHIHMLTCALVLLLLGEKGHAQDGISGLWSSGDGTRVYEMANHGQEYEARIHSSTRAGDSSGTIILDRLTPAKQAGLYKGLIHAGAADPVVEADVQLESNGEALRVHIPRMLLFPVNLVWKRVH
jgi:hypothetical protein